MHFRVSPSVYNIHILMPVNKKLQSPLEKDFPKKRLLSYLNRVQSKSVKALTPKQVQKVFLFARKDFIEGKIYFEDFIAICNHLWFDAIPNSDKGTEFADLLLQTAELSYYIRKADNEERANIVAVNLREALTYSPLN